MTPISFRPSLISTCIFLILPWLCACSHQAIIKPEPITAPAGFKENTIWQRAALTENTIPAKWWLLFQDETLNDLQQKLDAGNTNIKTALSQMLKARAILASNQSALFPQLSIGVAASQNHTKSTNSSNLALQTDTSWELDLWGRLSQTVSASNDTLQASMDDVAAARLSAQLSLAQMYFALCTYDAQLTWLDATLVAYQRMLKLTQTRYQYGMVARTDVLQAQIQLDNAQAQKVEWITQRALIEHAIAVMMGAMPSTFSLKTSGKLPASPNVPPMLPATLLERRPDITAAQKRVAAAYKNIGIADAAYFPNIRLSAQGQYGGNLSLSNLFNAPSLLWALGATLTQQLIDNGQKKLASTQARIEADQLNNLYRQTVLNAFQEVEDNLMTLQQLNQQIQLQTQTLQSAQTNRVIVDKQYQAGIVAYLNVLNAQNTAFTQERTMLDLRHRQLISVAVLLKNIGGRHDQ